MERQAFLPHRASRSIRLASNLIIPPAICRSSCARHFTQHSCWRSIPLPFRFRGNGMSRRKAALTTHLSAGFSRWRANTNCIWSCSGSEHGKRHDGVYAGMGQAGYHALPARGTERRTKGFESFAALPGQSGGRSESLRPHDADAQKAGQ